MSDTSRITSRTIARRKCVILFLAVNPRGTPRLALDEECAAIERELRMTTGRDDFDFRSKWAVSVDDMMRYLNELQPTIIHFSGHGSHNDETDIQGIRYVTIGAFRDVAISSDTYLQLQDEQEQSQYIGIYALVNMIRTAATSARVVVLNACFTDAMAESLCTVVDCVVGMRGAIRDDAARAFSSGFYRALGYRRSIGNAVAQAVAGLASRHLSAERLPVCRSRDGINVDAMFLTEERNAETCEPDPRSRDLRRKSWWARRGVFGAAMSVAAITILFASSSLLHRAHEEQSVLSKACNQPSITIWLG